MRPNKPIFCSIHRYMWSRWGKLNKFTWFCSETKPLCFYSDLVKTLGQAVEKDVVYEQQPYDQWSKKLQGVGLPEWMVSICSKKKISLKEIFYGNYH